jgi:small nuclear ribonucleoprotein F
MSDVLPSAPINPVPFLHELTGKDVALRLKWGNLEIRGVLQSVDSYMNFQILNSEEWKDGNFKGALGEVFVRCNNVLFIREFQKH